MTFSAQGNKQSIFSTDDPTNPDIEILLQQSTEFSRVKVAAQDRAVEVLKGINLSSRQHKEDDQSAMIDNKDIQRADDILYNLIEDQNFQENIQSIWTFTNSLDTKDFVLINVEKVVKTKWNIIIMNKKQGLKRSIYGLHEKLSTLESGEEKNLLLPKLNRIIAEFLRKELCMMSSNVIEDLQQQSYTDQNICQNNIEILLDICEEVFDTNKDATKSQTNKFEDTKKIIQQLEKNYKGIYELCDFILRSCITDQNSVKQELVKKTLELITLFFDRMPYEYFYHSDFIEGIQFNLFESPYFIQDVITVFVEFAKLDILNDIKDNPLATNTYESVNEEFVKKKLLAMLNTFNVKIQKVFSLSTDLEITRLHLVKMCKDKSLKTKKNLENFETLTKNLAKFYYYFYIANQTWIEQLALSLDDIEEQSYICEILKVGMIYMNNLTEINDPSLFYIVCDFWLWVTDSILEKDDCSMEQLFSPSALKYRKHRQSGAERQSFKQVLSEDLIKFQVTVYNQDLVSRTLKSLIEKMPPPQEFYISVYYSGLTNKRNHENNQNQYLYNTIKTILKNICDQSWESTRLTINYKLEKLLDDSEFSELILSKLCWAIACFNNKVVQNDKDFLRIIIRNLVCLAENKADEYTRSFITANLFYILSNFPEFLMKNPNLTMVAQSKLVDLMKSKTFAVQEIAVKNWYEICKCCKEKQVIVGFFNFHPFRVNPKVSKKILQPNSLEGQEGKIIGNNLDANIASEKKSYLQFLLEEVNNIAESLYDSNQIIFYEGLIEVINAEPELETKLDYLKEILTVIIENWINIVTKIQANNEVILESSNTKFIIFFVSLNLKLSETFKFDYQNIFKELCQSFIYVETVYLEIFSGLDDDSAEKIKILEINDKILDLMCSFTQVAVDNKEDFSNKFAKRLMLAIECFSNSSNESRSVKTITLGKYMIQSQSETHPDLFNEIWFTLWRPNVEIIKEFLEKEVELASEFFNFVQAAFNYWFEQVYQNLVQTKEIDELLRIILIAINSRQSNKLTALALNCTESLIKKVNDNENVATVCKFWSGHYMFIYEGIVKIIGEGLEFTGNFYKLTKIYKLQIHATKKMSLRLFEKSHNNYQSLLDHTVEIFNGLYPNLFVNHHSQWLAKVFSDAFENEKNFENTVRDYLITLKENDISNS